MTTDEVVVALGQVIIAFEIDPKIDWSLFVRITAANIQGQPKCQTLPVLVPLAERGKVHALEIALAAGRYRNFKVRIVVQRNRPAGEVHRSA